MEILKDFGIVIIAVVLFICIMIGISHFNNTEYEYATTSGQTGICERIIRNGGAVQCFDINTGETVVPERYKEINE